MKKNLSSESNVKPAYLNSSVPVQERITDLLKRMTIEEKIGQMTQLDVTLINKTGKQKDVELDAEKASEYLTEHHIGSFLNGEAVSRDQWHEFMSGLQDIAVNKTRLKIPVIYGIDHMHGASYVKNATIFPHNINLAATFNPAHAYHSADATVSESGDLGHNWIFAPVLDLGRNPKWPRFYETFGESFVVASAFGKAYVKGIQEQKKNYDHRIAATAKHFLGYSDPGTGWDRSPVDLADQTIHEFYVPSFKAAIDAGLKTVMLNSGEINGVPVHASHKIITGLLRDKLGFQGVVVTDWDDIGKLTDFHKTAENYTEAVYQSVSAGIDVCMTPLHLKFNSSMVKLIEQGRITEERIDRSVARILKLKFDLGLFEQSLPHLNKLDPLVRDRNRANALNAARESLVLLKNEQRILPLSQKRQTILLTGPSAASKRDLSGGWTYSWQGADDKDYPDDVLNIYQAMTKEFPNADILIPENWRDRNEICHLAERSDLIITAIGEEPYSEFAGNITDMNLPQEQIDMITALSGFDKPVISVYVGGRPRLVSDIIDNIQAFVWAGLPGTQGAQAISELLSGSFNPSGKLPFSYPKFPSHHVPYNHKNSAVFDFDPDNANQIRKNTKDIWQWKFGEGLSYTKFSYSDLRISQKIVTEAEHLTATVKIKNNGSCPGIIPVLWFIKDEFGSISRPVKELKHFSSEKLNAGEEKEISFEIIPDLHLSYPDSDGNTLLEEGDFTLSVGELSITLRLSSL